MRSRRPLAVCVAVAALVASTMPGSSIARPRIANPFARNAVPGQIIVRFAPGAPAAAVRRLNASVGARTLDSIDELGAVLVSVPGSAQAAAAVYKASNLVLTAEPNLLGHTDAAPPPSRANDPFVAGLGPTFADRQWYLQRINALYAWVVWPHTYYSSVSKPANTVKVAVLDTWVQPDHSDFSNAGGNSTRASSGGQIDLADTKSFVPANKVHGPLDWHGTHVAGIIGAAADNSRDIAGIAYFAQVMPVVVADGNGVTTAFTLSKGIAWASSHGAKVVNISLSIQGAGSEAETLRRAIESAVARGSLIVTAAGNGDGDDAELPAGFASDDGGVMAVGATNIFDERASCSKKGRHLTVSAPGELIWSLDPYAVSNERDDATRRETCGTSQAAAVVSGVAALVTGRYPGLSPAAISKRITDGADDIDAPGRDDNTGAGRVNAERALWPGGGPGTTWVSLPTAGNSVTVTANARSSAGIADAEVLLDGRRRGFGNKARPRDGRFGGQNELVSTTFDTSRIQEGPHEIQVRARDSHGAWGPAATGVLVVDHSPPSVTGVKCTIRTVDGIVNPDDPSSSVMFAVSDTWSKTMRVIVDLIDATFASQAHFEFKALPSATYQLAWRRDVEGRHNGPLAPGVYRVIVNVRDLAGYEVYNEGQCVVGATARSLPTSSPSAGVPGGPGGVPTAVPTSRPSPTVSASPTTAPVPTATPTR